MLALVGGAEFTPACRRMDRALIQALGLRDPKVLILPTAAAPEDPERAARNGTAYFAGLGVAASVCMLLTRGDAEDPRLLEPLREAQLIYLVGGSPHHLLQTLRGTAAWRLMVEQHRSGIAIVGSSAGAMVLAEKMWGGEAAWEDALGLLPRVALLPHLERHQPERVATLRASLERGLVLLGIDSATACVNTGGSTWLALGAGRAVVYRGGRAGSYRHGQTFSLGPRRPVHGGAAQ